MHKIEFQGGRVSRAGARVSIGSDLDLFSVPPDDCSAFGLGLVATMSLRCDSDDVDSAPGKMEESGELPRALMPLWDQMQGHLTPSDPWFGICLSAFLRLAICHACCIV